MIFRAALPSKLAAALFFLLAVAAGGSAADVPECRGCNVILVSLDTLRADALGAYGSKFGSSPAIDRAAKKGVLFQNAFSPVPSTIPSHMSIFSGLYPSRHGIKTAWMPDRLNSPHPLLAEIFSDLGYRTAWAWISPYVSEDPMVNVRYAGFRKGFETFINEDASRSTGALTAFAWLEKNAAEPFFLFLHQYRMHDPYAPSRRALQLFSKKLRRQNYLSSEDINQKLAEALSRDPSLLTETQTKFGIMKQYHRYYTLRDQGIFWRQFDLSKPGDRDDLKALYSINLYDVDEWIAALLGRLNDLKLLDKTVIILMSDHGEEFAEHGKYSHSQMYDESVRVPLIFLVPGAKGRKVSQVVSTVDVYPTLLDIVGVGVPETVQGLSLRPLMGGGTYPGGRAVFGDHWARSSSYVRDAKYSYIIDRSEGFMEKFFDRVRDPGELRDLIAAGEADLIDKYRRLLKSHMEGN